MQPHFFISDSDGALYDTRAADWSAKPLRPNYRRTHAEIATVADFKACLRAGGYAWPGGYPVYFVTADGAALSYDSARAEFRQIAAAIVSGDRRGGWHVCGTAINYEDPDLVCDHSGKPIECAYSD